MAEFWPKSPLEYRRTVALHHGLPSPAGPSAVTLRDILTVRPAQWPVPVGQHAAGPKPIAQDSVARPIDATRLPLSRLSNAPLMPRSAVNMVDKIGSVGCPFYPADSR